MSHHSSSTELFPVSMDRCVVVSKERVCCFMADHGSVSGTSPDWANFVPDPLRPTWHCQIAQADERPLVQNWWLIISPTETGQPHLTVIQPPAAVPENAGYLAARVTFRLHALRRRVLAQGLSPKQILRLVNHHILQAMQNMPV